MNPSPHLRPVAAPGGGRPRRSGRHHHGFRLAGLLFLAASMTASLPGAVQNTPAINTAASWLTIDKVVVDGEPVATNIAALNGVLKLSPGAHRVNFQFGPIPDAADQPLRLRYKLAGADAEWQEAGGAMRFTVRLTDTNNDPFAFQDFPATRESAGWDGTPANSTFSYRRKVLTMPRDILFIQLGLASGLAGSAYTDGLGMMVIDDVRVSVIRDVPEAKEELVYEYDFEKGVNLDSETGTPADWTRSIRLHPNMHIVVRAGPDPRNHALAVRDTHTRLIAQWNCRPANDLHLKRGDKLVLEWKEMFTVGAGGTQTASYQNIRPGKYTFHVRAMTPLGEATRHSTALTIIIPEFPFWRTAKFIAWLIILTGGIFLTQAVWLMRQRLKRQVERLQWQQAVEHERTRIARDIHDDLGTSLTRISMLCQSARTPADIQNISTITREMTRSMDEIVWAVNPDNDSLDELATYLGGFAQELLTSASLRCRLNLPMQLPPWNLPAELRHNVFLAFKEALNNILKHAAATEVHITLVAEESRFVLSVADNGRALPAPQRPAEKPAAKLGGHGLDNMRSRMEKIGGQFSIAPNPNGGTTVCFIVPIPAIQRQPAPL